MLFLRVFEDRGPVQVRPHPLGDAQDDDGGLVAVDRHGKRFGNEALSDHEFGRGSTLYNHFRGDMEHKPNPNPAPAGKGPFYAAKIQMGDPGTFAGIGVNERSEVTTEVGTAVPGLVAVGAAAVSVFGAGI